ncbi:hypothetical protein BBBOND_0210820 [Babesia bigemina]|uniref:Ribosome-binding protein 1 n=1 Tax=Babesia bigemina TaxID=5866 RepID=A0A061D7H2_BABBI|nr:hypothetical protein BBBOND_0210820 [Babesia bigemina]CDR95932.1 hypothetical protein BBBOND_0210820 [Babesia bigemina]|eukprot:XP_012768118.1 hypothetical protein BBBOND_0210820 [Babesia bigemina]
MASAVGFYFDNLKDCLVFFQWLYGGAGKNKLLDVVKKLCVLLEPCYKTINEDKIRSDLLKFLFKVDAFYGKLVRKKSNNGPSIPQDESLTTPEKILDALLFCLPKFYAAIYYLWYDVNQNFKMQGGGGWKNDYPGYDGKDVFGRNWGGDLQKYLTGTSKHHNHNNVELLLGGFQEGDIKYGYNDSSGFYQGRSMLTELANLVDKESTKWNLVRDVFSTTALPTHGGSDKPNAANVLAVIDTLCETVKTERSVLALEVHEGLEKRFIDWQGLVNHCQFLRHSFGKLFKGGAFSFTGYRRASNEVKSAGFTKRAAAWLRGHLDHVMEALDGITPYRGNKYLSIFDKEKHHHMINSYYAELGDYFTKNVFPYGFTLFGDNIYTLPNDPHKTLLDDWNNEIKWLKGENGLGKLKNLLEGLKYPIGYNHGEGINVTQPNDESKHHVVTATGGPSHVTNIIEGTTNDNDQDAQSSIPKKDYRESQHEGPTDVKKTSDSATTSGVDTSDGNSEIIERNGYNDDGDDTECNHKVPDMHDGSDDACYHHMRVQRPLNTD